MLFIRHFMLILLLFPASGPQKIRRIQIHKHIFIIISYDQLQRRGTFDLHPSQPLRDLDHPFRQTVPVPQRIHPLPSLHVILPADLIAIRSKSMPLPAPDKELTSLEKSISFRQHFHNRITLKRIIIHLPAVRRCHNQPRQLFRILPDALEEVHHIPVQVIDRLYV